MLKLTVALAGIYFDDSNDSNDFCSTRNLSHGTMELERRRVGVHNSLQPWTCTADFLSTLEDFLKSANCYVCVRL